MDKFVLIGYSDDPDNVKYFKSLVSSYYQEVPIVHVILTEQTCNWDFIKSKPVLLKALEESKKVIIAGKDVLGRRVKENGKDVIKGLYPEYVDAKVDDIRETGIENNNELIPHKHIDVIYNYNYYMYQGMIETFFFDLENRLGFKVVTPEVPKLEVVVPHYHHISELKEVFNTKWGKDENLGFDFETRGFPMSENFRPLGFSLCNDTYQAAFYFSREDDKYQEELEKYGPDLLEICKNNHDRLWVFNASFEDLVIFHLFNEYIFFQDTRVFTYLLKTRGSLKYSANFMLQVPLWNETVHDYINVYNKFSEWLNNFNRIYKTEDIEVDPDLKSILTELVVNRKHSEIFTLLHLTPESELDDNHVYIDLRSNRSKLYIHIEYIHKVNDLLSNDDLFLKYFEELKDGDETQKYIYEYYHYVKDDIDGELGPLDFLKMYKDGCNDWQSAPRGIMFKYCSLDSYYTIKIKDMLYDVNYHGVKNGYPYFISQTNLGSLIDANGVAIDENFYKEYKRWIESDLLRGLRYIAKYPDLVDIVCKETYDQKTRDAIWNNTESYFKSLGGGRILNNVKGYFQTYTDKDFKDNVTKLVHAIRSSSTDVSDRSFRKTLNGYQLQGTWDVLALINKNLEVGLTRSIVDCLESELSEKIESVSKIFKDIYDKIMDTIGVSFDDVKKEYLDWIDSRTSYEDILNKLNFGSPAPESQYKFYTAIYKNPEYKNSLIRSLTQWDWFKAHPDKTEEFKELDSLKNEEFLQKLKDLSKTDPNNSLFEGLKSAMDTFKQIIAGERAGKEDRREVSESVYRAEVADKDLDESEVADLDKMTPGMQYIYWFNVVKSELKSYNTLVKGNLGGANFHQTKDLMHPIDSSSTEGTKTIYKCGIQMNTKDTLRSASTFHTIPPENDFCLSYRPRDDNRLLVHMDLAQSEARLAFSISNEEKMIQAMKNKFDIHSFNANLAFDLGYSNEELYKVKENYSHQRQLSKLITFAILYGAGVGAIAKQMNKPVDYAQEVLDKYMKGNPNLKKYIDHSRQELKDRFGFLRLPIFGFDFFMVNPFSYKLNQKALNYQIQNISSSLCAHIGYHFFEDLRKNYGILIKIHGFIHDAIEFDVDAKDIFTVLDRIHYWFEDYPYEEWHAPISYDCEVGINKYAVSAVKYTKMDEKTILAEFSSVSYPVFGDPKYKDCTEKYIGMLKDNFNVLKVQEVSREPCGSKINKDDYHGWRIFNYCYQPEVSKTLFKSKFKVLLELK